jgi:hypothetical protein
MASPSASLDASVRLAALDIVRDGGRGVAALALTTPLHATARAVFVTALAGPQPP